MSKLQSLVEFHERRSFPRHPSDDELDDLILELAEFDSWAIGVAKTIMCGGNVKVQKEHFAALVKLREKLDGLPVTGEEDISIKNDAIMYCESVGEIIKEAIKFAEGGI